jgi:hypothetical protein
MTQPLWDVVVRAEHGQHAFTVHQRVRAGSEAQARERAAEVAAGDLAGLGHVVGTGTVKRATE